MSSFNVCKRFLDSQRTGRGIQRTHQLPLSVLRQSEDEDELLKQATTLLLEISKNAYGGNYKLTLHQKIKALHSLLFLDRQPIYSMVCEFGMIEILLDVMLEEFFQIHKVDRAQKSIIRCPKSRLDDCAEILHIVGTCIMASKASYHHLRWNCRVVEALFSLESELHFINNHASSILEVILLGTDHLPLRLEDINGLGGLISRFPVNEKHASFFHTLSTFMSDSEHIASCHFTLEKHDHGLAKDAVKIVDANQDFLLNIPDFFEKMCTAAGQPFSGPESHPQPILSDMMYVLHLFSTTYGSVQDIPGGDVFLQAVEHKHMVFRADLFHIISHLLLGKNRNKVQERLSASNFFTELHSSAEQIIWINPDAPMLGGPVGDSMTECSAEIFAQTQFLRLIHSIADNHPNRYYLLSHAELDQLKALAIARNLDLPTELVEFPQDRMYPGDRGLMSMIVDKLKAEPANSVIRFWITRAMEAFLRGESSPVHQMFLLNKDLIEDTVDVILTSEVRNDMVIQGSFDFLSTIMRNNVEAFQLFDAAIDCTAKFMQLIREINENLVDSNMFLRCIVLTNEHLKRMDPIQADSIRQNRLLNRYSNMESLLEVLSSLIRLLTVPTVSQENVSCLNTILLICIFAHREGKLPKYLAALSQLSDGQGVLANLKSLVQFWRIHYNLPSKKTDRTNLELSSGVKFSEWQSSADALVEADPSSPLSVYRYLVAVPASSFIMGRTA